MSVATSTRSSLSLKRLSVRVRCVLGLVAVDRVGLDAAALELLREAVGAVLGLA